MTQRRRNARGDGGQGLEGQTGGNLTMNPFSAPGVSGAVAHPCSLPGPVPTSGLFPQLWEESEARGTEGGKPLEPCIREEAGVLVRLGPWSQSCQAGAQGLQSVNTFFPGILCCSKGLRGPWREGQTSNASFPSPPGASPSGTGWGQCLLGHNVLSL